MPVLYQDAVAHGEISAPSPSEPSEQVSLRPDPAVIRKLAETRSTTQLLQYFYNICGILPPVNNIGYHEKDVVVDFPDNSNGIMDCVAVFQGLNRPCNGDGEDKLVFVYVTKPNYYYSYHPHMACCAKRRAAPEGTVFVVYVKFDDDTLGSGEVIQWEIVVADSVEPSLPQDYNERYDSKRWSK